MVNNPFSEGLSVQVSADTDQAQNALGNLAGSFGSARLAGLAFAGVLAGAVVAGLAAATKRAAEFEEAMVEVQKVTSEETAAQVSEEIMELSRTIPLAQEELAGLAADAGRFGVEGSENIAKFTETVAKMAIATNLSSREAGEALARLGTLTRTPVDEMENLGSAVNELSNNFATSSSEIVDSALRSAGALTNLGLETPEIFALTAALNEVSESSQRAGTRLRRVAQVLVDPDKVTKIAQALGMTTEEFERMRDEDPTQTIMLLAETLGDGSEAGEELASALDTRVRQALIGLRQNSEGVTEAIETSNTATREATSLQKEFDAASATLNSRVQILKNRISELAIGIGTEMLPVAKGLVNVLIGATDAVIKFGQAANRAFSTARQELIDLSEAQMSVFGVDVNPFQNPTEGVTAYGRAIKAAREETDDFAATVSDSLQRSEVDRFNSIAGALGDIGTAGEAAASGVQKTKDKINNAIDAFKDFRTVTSIEGTVFEIATTGEEPRALFGEQQIQRALQGIGARFRTPEGMAGSGRTRAPQAVDVSTDTNVEVVIEGDEQGIIQIVDQRVTEETRTSRRLRGRPGGL